MVVIHQVSHDRAFLDAVATDVVLMARRQLTYYRGDYGAFERRCAEEERRCALQLEGLAGGMARRPPGAACW